MPILHWLTRDEDLRAAAHAPYRLLDEAIDLSAGEPGAGNLLIQGDNLEALKALLPFHAGQVQCIYIDPPFNTGQAFPDYDDNLEHSIWLGMMYPRLEMLHQLLAPHGSLFLHLDDNEVDYARVAIDEIFGRKNFVSRITLKARSPSAFSTVNPGVFKASEYLLWYAKGRQEMYQNRVWVPREPDTAYNKIIDDLQVPYDRWEINPIGPYIIEGMKKARTPRAVSKIVRSFYVENADRIVRLAEIDDGGAGQDIVSVKRESLHYPEKIFLHKREKYDDVFIVNGKQLLFYSKNIHEIDGESTPARMLTNIWDDISWEGIAGEGSVRFPRGKKPERLIRRCLQLATNPGDLVLDSFLGSGTTAAVAHKMGRHWIGIEMGEHAVTHCAPRLKKVIEGEQGGISKAVGWRGGGGFRFYRLGPPAFDADGRICPDIRFLVLAAHLWFSETGRPWTAPLELSPFLGAHDGRGYALLYNGILCDRSADGGNVLTRRTLALIRTAADGFGGPLTIYGVRSALGAAALQAERLTFKQIPYDVKARA